MMTKILRDSEAMKGIRHPFMMWPFLSLRRRGSPSNI